MPDKNTPNSPFSRHPVCLALTPAEFAAFNAIAGRGGRSSALKRAFGEWLDEFAPALGALWHLGTHTYRTPCDWSLYSGIAERGADAHDSSDTPAERVYIQMADGTSHLIAWDYKTPEGDKRILALLAWIHAQTEDSPHRLPAGAQLVRR